MLIGIMSDTHDNLQAIAKAVELFNRENVELVIHAGDYVAPFVARELKKLKAPLKGVFGNNDGERKGLYEALGIYDELIELEADGMKIAVTHGTNGVLVRALVRSRLYDVVVVGHTHRYEIREEGRTILVNPGEVCGYVSGVKSVALLDTRKREVRIINLDTGELLGAMSL
ncbi:putative metallo-dependent phosphatase [Thermococcus cleftensis]|uniref:Phosphoesterase n=1 Tax=Thermococcus cleftensis (strain DSM 27260 / KACC 17922 / CL1) TaxID=163003 RepID=I3ZT22_THECF|nr:metallophosphoesterase [Thermococcus cleftensis]AFL94856.1 putative metallo-dependent phosphatase [Thermococcus cleftensis]